MGQTFGDLPAFHARAGHVRRDQGPLFEGNVAKHGGGGAEAG